MDAEKLWFDRLLVPKTPNEKAVGEYLTSKQTIKQIPRLWERGDAFARDVRATCYVAQKKLNHVEKRLKVKRKAAIETRISLDKQWADLNEKEESLRDMFIKFSQFVNENKEKRDRATADLQEQDKINRLKVTEIEDLSREVKDMDFMYRKIDEIFHNHWIFETFLTKVVDQSPEKFQHPLDILKRYEALRLTKDLLNDHQQKVAAELDHLKTEYRKLIDDYIVKLSGLHVKLADLHQRYETARISALKWEKLLLNIRTEATEKIIDLTAIKESSRRMYKEICERKGIEPVSMNDYGKQFDVIKKALHDFECINKTVRVLEEEKLILSEKPNMSDGTEWLSGSD